MTTFGTRQTAGVKPAFGNKTAPSPAGRVLPAPKDRLSPEAIAFLNAERARAPVQPAQPSYATPKAAPTRRKVSSAPNWVLTSCAATMV